MFLQVGGIGMQVSGTTEGGPATCFCGKASHKKQLKVNRKVMERRKAFQSRHQMGAEGNFHGGQPCGIGAGGLSGRNDKIAHEGRFISSWKDVLRAKALL